MQKKRIRQEEQEAREREQGKFKDILPTPECEVEECTCTSTHRLMCEGLTSLLCTTHTHRAVVTALLTSKAFCVDVKVREALTYKLY